MTVFIGLQQGPGFSTLEVLFGTFEGTVAVIVLLAGSHQQQRGRKKDQDLFHFLVFLFCDAKMRRPGTRRKTPVYELSIPTPELKLQILPYTSSAETCNSYASALSRPPPVAKFALVKTPTCSNKFPFCS